MDYFKIFLFLALIIAGLVYALYCYIKNQNK